MTQAKRDKVVETIRKLMSKAQDEATTPKEAAAFAGKVQELMLKHSIEMTELEFRELQDKDPVKPWIVDHATIGLEQKQREPFWSGVLIDAVARAHSCDVLHLTGRGTSFVVIGRASDMEVALFMYHTLYNMCEVMCDRGYAQEWKRGQAIGNVTIARGYKESFRNAFVLTVESRYRAMREKVEATGVSLMHVSKTEADVKDMASELATGEKEQLARVTHARGVSDGMKAGNKVNLNARAVKGNGTKGELNA